MNLKHLEEQAKAVAATVRDYCAKAIGPVLQRMDRLETELKDLAEIGHPQVLQSDIEAAAQLAAALIPIPTNGKDGEKGADGKDGESVSLEVVKSLVEETVKTLPAPEVVTLEQTQQILDELVAKAVTGIPAPQDGAPGKDGESVDLAIVDEHIEARVASYSEKLATEQAEALAKAVTAIPIPQDGAPGKDGESVSPEQLQVMIDKAVEERLAAIAPPETVTLAQAQQMVNEAVAKAMEALPVPKDGRDGKDGQDGEDGRDALALEILPGIDETKSYRRGAYATHNGGLFRSYEKTEGMRGWECIIEGVASVEMKQIDERNFVIQLTTASGKVVEHKAYLPTMIYRGFYQEGKTYEPGDSLTWAGSLWHCNEETPHKPGTDEAKGAWTLATKRGRDGKDGTNGRDLVSGVSIK